MAISLTSGILEVDEGSFSTADELLYAGNTVTFYDTGLGSLYANLAAQAVTGAAALSTPQKAVDQGMFNIAANTKDLLLSSAGTLSSGAVQQFSTSIGVDSGLTTVDGKKIFLFAVSGDDDIVVGRVGADATSAKDGGIAFSIALDEQVDQTTGYVTKAQLWITQYAAITNVGVDKIDANDFQALTQKLFVASSESVTNENTTFSTASSGAPVYAIVTPPSNSQDLSVLVTAFNSDDPSTTIHEDYLSQRLNISTTGFGVGSQSVTAPPNGAGIRLDYVRNGVAGAGSDPTGSFSSHNHNITNAGFGITQIQGGGTTADVKVTAIQANAPDDDATNFFADLGKNDTVVTIEAVRVKDASGNVVYLGGNVANANGLTISGVGSASAVTVKGVQLNWTVEVVNKIGTFDRLTVENVGSKGFDVGHLIYTAPPTVQNTVVELGSHVHFLDGGPSVTTDATQVGAWIVDESTPNSSDHHSVAAAFTASGGPDGTDTIAYALSATAGKSGLKSGGEDVLLRLSNGVVEGYTASNSKVIFSVSVNSSTGDVTVTESGHLDHPGTSDPDDAVAMAASLIQVSQTVTDKDGDHATGSVSISDKISFKDDGPTAVAGSDVSLSSTDGSSIAGQGTASFTIGYGADGAGTTTYALTINTAATGLTSGGKAITLSMSGADVVGKTSDGVLVFTVSSTGSGALTLVQSAALDHSGGTARTLNGAISLTATVKDGDGDAASASDKINLSFADGAPTITGSGPVSLATSDANLGPSGHDVKAATFTPDYGPDGAGSVSYSLIGTGSTSLTSAGKAISLSKDAGGVIHGATSDGDVFTVSVDPSGQVTLTQFKAIDHAAGSDTASLNGAISISAVATDGDGSTSAPASQGVNLTFADDKPTITADASASLSTSDATLGTDTKAVTITPAYGADGAGATHSALVINAATTGLTSHGSAITLVADGADVVGKADTTEVFRVSFSGGQVTLKQSATIDHQVGSDTASLTGAISLSSSATDSDGDVSSAATTALNLAFGDATPTATAAAPSVTLTTSDDSLGGAGAASQATAFITAYGNDGAGSTAFALALTGGSSTALTSGTKPIKLSIDGSGVVHGATADGDVFTVSVDAGGKVTLTQLKAVDQAADAVNLTGALTVTCTVTDSDGDKASASEGVNLSFTDSKPSITATGSTVAFAVDESSLNVGDKHSILALFDGKYGADGAGTTTYALTATTGTATNLLDTLTGEQVTLKAVSGTEVDGVNGHGDVVFTVTLSGSDATLTQLRAVKHGDTSNPNDTVTLTPQLITVTATITDADGDAKAAGADLSASMTFSDDGPSIALKQGATAVALASSDAALNTPSVSASDFAAAQYGADSNGTTTYSLTCSAGDSGLMSGGEAVQLKTENGSVVGYTSKGSVFTVSVDVTGKVSLTQAAAIDHDANSDTASLTGKIQVTATATDGDGDKAAASEAVNLTFADDKPTIALSGTKVSFIVDESGLGTGSTPNSALVTSQQDITGLFIGKPGADSIGATTTYSLAAASDGTPTGLVDTLTQSGVALRTISATEVDGVNANNDVVFTVTLANGKVTLTQARSVVQNNKLDPNDGATLAAGLISLSATITDGDHDSASRTISISDLMTFNDDGPSLATKSGTGSVTADDAQLKQAFTGSFADYFATPTFGADGAGSLDYKFAIKSTNSGLTDVNGKQVFLTLSADGKTITGKETDAAGTTVFTLALDSSGNASLTQSIAIKHAVNTSLATLSANALHLIATATDGDGDTKTQEIDVSGNISFKDATPEFIETTVAGGTKAVDDMILQYRNGIQGNDTFKVDFHNDVPGTSVTISSFDASSHEGLLANQTSAAHIDYVKSLDPLTKPIYSLDVTDTGYTVSVVNAPDGLPQKIAFEKLPSGSPTETVTATLTGDYGGSVKIDGLIFDPSKAIKATSSVVGGVTVWKADYTAALDPKQNGAASDADDVNTNNIGFGIKGGQASQINPNEGFRVDYLAPTHPDQTGGLDHLKHLSFDVYGIGNIPNVNIHYWLYRTDGSLVDEGWRKTSEHITNGAVDKTGLTLTDNKAHNIDLFDDGTATGTAGLQGANDYFDYAVVQFDFSPAAAKNGSIPDNIGVRVGTFFTEIIQTPEKDSFNFEVKATDVDGDVALGGSTHVALDPAHSGWHLV
ncbi:DUF5801 repeats-in-toxin domain-containing protein [Methylobacterium sp. WSM2598]|uniref:DUF5801 repeats-in-toxin domain-containing protein n=1 Tax=Methylobacterium sp. WSM2598 TaxID=398261 RepID=UPI00035D1CCE|nr:DUF5801 repeats-in-toxin domain-containing protein [Methylobacterium sp. WSM2598]